jgi:hypothetical protein
MMKFEVFVLSIAALSERYMTFQYYSLKLGSIIPKLLL